MSRPKPEKVDLKEFTVSKTRMRKKAMKEKRMQKWFESQQINGYMWKRQMSDLCDAESHGKMLDQKHKHEKQEQNKENKSKKVKE